MFYNTFINECGVHVLYIPRDIIGRTPPPLSNQWFQVFSNHDKKENSSYTKLVFIFSVIALTYLK